MQDRFTTGEITLFRSGNRLSGYQICSKSFLLGSKKAAGEGMDVPGEGGGWFMNFERGEALDKGMRP